MATLLVAGKSRAEPGASCPDAKILYTRYDMNHAE
jgi:hypothetical protein